MRYILIALIFLQVSLASAQRCESIYGQQMTAEQYALSLGVEKGKDLWSKHLWKKYLKKWKPNKAYTEQSFDARINESYELIQKMRIRQGLIDNRHRDFYAKPEEVVAWAEKALMKEGLKGYLYNIPQKQKLPARIYQKMVRILQTKPMRILGNVMMQTLPHQPDKPIPDELLAKMLIDGVDAHFAELKEAFKPGKQSLKEALTLQKQSNIESYRRIQTAVKYLSLSVSAMIYFHQIDMVIQKQTEQNKTELVEQLETMDKGLDDIERMLDAGEFDS